MIKICLRKAENPHRTGIELRDSMLLKYFGIKSPQIMTGEYGKPYVENKNVYFNISHSGKYTLCAVSDSEIGVDLEFLKSNSRKKEIIKRFFTPEEFEYFRCNKYSKSCFYELWTKKESLMKFLGLGIGFMKKYNILEYEKMFKSHVCGNYMITVCSENPDDCETVK